MKEKRQKKQIRPKLNLKFTIAILGIVIVPITILVCVLFYNMERNVIDENVNYMQYTMERRQDNIEENIDSVTMTMRFFLGDQSLQKILNNVVQDEAMNAEELMEYYHSDIAFLERLMNNNTLLYGVRVYAVNDQVQEMMPILYKHSRMEKLAWAEKEDFTGWNFGYQDKIFDILDKKTIASLVTEIEDYENGCIGIIETAVMMEDLLPPLYESIENERSCFVTNKGDLYFGNQDIQLYEEVIHSEIAEGLEQDGIHTVYKKKGKEHYIISYLYIKSMDGTLMSVQNISGKLNRIYRMRTIFIYAMFAIVIGLTFFINHIVKRLLKHFYEILKAIRTIQKGNLSVRITNNSADEMGELGIQINKMLDRIEQLIKENVDREVLVKNSEIRALQNQINAHFIYNVLESIKMMAEIDEEYAISDAISSLGKLLRYSIRWVSGNVCLREEIEYIQNYLALMNLRFNYEIYLSLNIPEIMLDQEIPKMSLQPIIENAIYHGIEDLAEDTNIYMKGTIEGTDCVIEITDAGKGMTGETLEHLKKKIAGEIEPDGGSGHGIGLKNVQDRIRMSFGENYGIEVASKLGCYTKITVRVPVKRNDKESERKA